jgi:hypothetical protein
MGMTLDEYLAEIDRWKQPVSDQGLALSATERTELDREARVWLEAKLGRPLEIAPWAEKKAVPT